MAIAKGLLIHGAAAYSVIEMDADRNPVYSDPVELTAVRCVPVKQNAFTDMGVQKDDKLTLFFDCAASRPAGFIPLPEMRIDFDGEAYTVRQVNPCYGRTADVHHYEVVLV